MQPMGIKTKLRQHKIKKWCKLARGIKANGVKQTGKKQGMSVYGQELNVLQGRRVKTGLSKILQLQ
jgi:hypothetical protein